MEAFKHYLGKNSEQVFVLLILLSVVGISYFAPYKLVFLNFFFIIILLGAHYLGVRRALLGAVLSSLIVTIHVYYFPGTFMPAFTHLDLWMSVLAWSSFLILTGAVMGKVTSELKKQLQQLDEITRELKLKSGLTTQEAGPEPKNLAL